MKLSKSLAALVAAAFALVLSACGDSAMERENRELRERLARAELDRSQQGPGIGSPTPLAPPPRGPATPSYGGPMTHVGGGVYCPAGIARQSLKDGWTKVGSLPNTLGREASIRNLRGLPDAVRAKALAGLGSMRPAVMKKGQIICSMAYGTGLVWDKIVANWSDIDTLQVVEQVIEHDGFLYHIGLPPKATGGCDNDYWYAERVGTPSTPVKVSPKAAPATPPKAGTDKPAPSPSAPKPTPTPAPQPPAATPAPAPAPTPAPAPAPKTDTPAPAAPTPPKTDTAPPPAAPTPATPPAPAPKTDAPPATPAPSPSAPKPPADGKPAEGEPKTK